MARTARRHKEFTTTRKESAYVTSEAQYRFWDHHLPMGRVAHLHVLDVATGHIRDLFEGTAYELPRTEPDATCFDLSPDGRHAAFVYDPGVRKQIDTGEALAELNLRSGKITPLLQDTAWNFESPRYSPEGSRIALVAAHQGKRHTQHHQLAVLQRSGHHEVVSEPWDHVVVTPLRSTTACPTSKTWPTTTR